MVWYGGQVMRAASMGLAVLLPLLVGVSVASSDDRDVWPSADAGYFVFTPAPEGRVTCWLGISAQKMPRSSGTLEVHLYPSRTFEGDEHEITIPELGIAKGYQDRCDLWPEGPWGTTRVLDYERGIFQIRYRADIHDHPGAFCDRAGEASGTVHIKLFSDKPLPRQPRAYIHCEAPSLPLWWGVE